MSKHVRDKNGHIIYDNTDNLDVVRVRKAQIEQSRADSANLIVLNRQVRRALDYINILENRVSILESKKIKNGN